MTQGKINKAILQPDHLLGKLAVILEKQKGSDIIINARSRPAIKIDGEVLYVGNQELTSEQTEAMAKRLLTDKQWKQFEACNEMNLMTEAPGIAHFRTNIFRQRGEVGLVLRLIPLNIPTLEELQLPELLKTLAVKKRGLVLFSGATGVGKSTSLAAMLDYRNSNRSDHIITVEDPIEFIHRNKESIITQREVGIDTDSYSAAMKSALRQAPDVILVGEIRDREVMEQALAFAETGHMVFATVHATTTRLTLERIVNMFPHERRDQLMLDLSHNLEAIITQRLMLHSSGKGRVAALEIMSNTPHIELLIRESRFAELLDAMSRSTIKEGVITIDNYIFDLYEQGKVTYEEALLYVDSPNNFRIRLRADSKQELPEELRSTSNEDWQLDKAASDETKNSLYGNFSR
ncbi:MAG: PilT/PilU family type 4a pilus ATPase [Gammaproteobacteria bacterium]|nr:PilT/PilU family type 4a pilus ATPase [Gammaproteobacteria bacterium]